MENRGIYGAKKNCSKITGQYKNTNRYDVSRVIQEVYDIRNGIEKIRVRIKCYKIKWGRLLKNKKMYRRFVWSCSEDR